MNDSLILLIFLLHAVATCYMTGLIWFVQVVHYPLLARVGAAEFGDYERRHIALTTWVVGPPMLVEAVTAASLCWLRPPGVLAWPVWLGVVLLAVVWISTACVQAPCHQLLSERFRSAVHHRLVTTNWVRTTVWSLRALLVFSMTWSALEYGGRHHPELQSFNAPMAQLSTGDKAPSFTAKAADGGDVSLSDFVGKKALVLFFYPRDHSPVCTRQACSFRDSYERFAEAGAEVIGVSSDSATEHQAFADRNRLPFRLISDADGSLRRAFGVRSVMGLLPGRTTYVIDKDGVIRLVFTAQFAADEHVERAIAALKDASQHCLE